MIDIGTTTLQLARWLHGRELTVITSNFAVIEELLPDESIELVVLGGIVRRNYRSLVGVLAEARCASPASRWCAHEDRAPRRRRLPRPDGLRGAARARRAVSGSTR